MVKEASLVSRLGLLVFVHLDSLDRTTDALASVRRGHSRPRATGKYIVHAPSCVSQEEVVPGQAL